MESILSNLHPGDAFGQQVGMDGEELATEGLKVDDLLDGRSQLIHCLNPLIVQRSVKRKFALVTLGRAASAVFQYLQQDVRLQFLGHQRVVVHKKQGLGNRWKC